MKTIKLTLAMLTLAIGTTASAFSGHTEPEKSTNPPVVYYYGNTGSGQYVKIADDQTNTEENCYDTDPNPCILQSTVEVLGGFQLGSPEQPEDIEPVEGSEGALWQFVDPQ